MNQKHTPGEWTTDEECIYHDGEMIAEVLGDDPIVHARLLAAGPQLLRACQAVLVAIKSGLPEDDLSAVIDRKNPLTINALESAIAKAQGQEVESR